MLRRAGKEKEALELSKTIPISPAVAALFKKRFGPEMVKKCGFNMAEAEAKFGPNWLNDTMQ
ncbi:MAG: hypothetical protein LBM77_06665 [Spirochaetaceae bacterium]|jgi:hypothetical protein|nr:hypothetical protein [Spirochaetaceae bacterium]